MTKNSDLATQDIVLCKKGTPPMAAEKIAELLKLLPDWHVEKDPGNNQPLRMIDSRVEDNTGISQLVRTYEFADFAEAKQFSDLVKAMADEANHHPFLHVEGNILTMRWWTHSIKGLHLNDFIMAARCDELYLHE